MLRTYVGCYTQSAAGLVVFTCIARGFSPETNDHFFCYIKKKMYQKYVHRNNNNKKKNLSQFTAAKMSDENDLLHRQLDFAIVLLLRRA